MPPQRPRKKRAPARRPRPWVPVAIVGTAAILAVVLIVVFSNVGGGSSSNSGLAATPGPTHAAPQHGASFGQDSAPLTLIEYYSFQCSHCADYASQIAPQIEKDFVDTGKLKIEFHALGLEGDMLRSSEAVACAGDQDRYVEYYHYLFANSARGFSEGKLREYAGDLGLDEAAFKECLDSGRHEPEMLSETKQAAQLSMGTPTFYLGNTGVIENKSLPYSGETSIVGAQPYDVFKKAIEDALAKL